MFQRVFTLVEMLIVIAIIGILASLLMPALMSAMEAGHEVSCASNLRNIGVIAGSYSGEYNNMLPPGVGATSTVGDFSPSAYGSSGMFITYLAGYNGRTPTSSWGNAQKYALTYSAGLFTCASDHNPANFPLAKPTAGGDWNVLLMGYNVNFYAWCFLRDRDKRESGSSAGTDAGRRVFRLSDAVYPSQTVLLGDAMNGDVFNSMISLDSSAPTLVVAGGNSRWGNSWRGPRLGHKQQIGFNALFFDGHVKGYTFLQYPASILNGWCTSH